MSKFLKSTALSPPRRPGDGFDLLDVVVINPHANDPSKMLVPTDTNLLKHFATKQKVDRRYHSQSVSPADKQRRSEESFELTDELKSAIGMKGINVHSNGSHSSTARVNLVISHEKTCSVSGAIFSQEEGMVKNNFAAIVKNAARFNMTKNLTWYNYYTGNHGVYFLGVITKIYHGNISIEEIDSVRFGAGMGAKVSGLCTALTKGHRSKSNSMTSTSEGIVGVHLLCFPFRKGEKEGMYSVLDPISIHWIDKNERKRIQNASRRHSWKVIEIKVDRKLNLSTRFLADCKASITSYTETVVNYAKQEFKMHDFYRIKSILIVTVTFSLLAPVLGSLSTNSSIFHISFTPRQVYVLQRVFEQAFEDFITHFISLSYT